MCDINYSFNKKCLQNKFSNFCSDTLLLYYADPFNN